jgi:23S rRNA-/tRNA-specific pseudouridylate synthase
MSVLIVFARNNGSLKKLHDEFRKGSVRKVYKALVCRSLGWEWGKGQIDLALVRDWERPPFMRVATADSRVLMKDEIRVSYDVRVGSGARRALRVGRGCWKRILRRV